MTQNASVSALLSMWKKLGDGVNGNVARITAWGSTQPTMAWVITDKPEVAQDLLEQEISLGKLSLIGMGGALGTLHIRLVAKWLHRQRGPMFFFGDFDPTSLCFYAALRSGMSSGLIHKGISISSLQSLLGIDRAKELVLAASFDLGEDERELLHYLYSSSSTGWLSAVDEEFIRSGKKIEIDVLGAYRISIGALFEATD